MRKRSLYAQGEKSQSKISTIVIMCIVLFCILFFGHSFSEKVAKIFVPDEPTVDAPAQPNAANAAAAPLIAPDQPAAAQQAAAPTNEPDQNQTLRPGTVILKTNQAAAQDMLGIIANR